MVCQFFFSSVSQDGSFEEAPQSWRLACHLPQHEPPGGLVGGRSNSDVQSVLRKVGVLSIFEVFGGFTVLF